MVVFSKGFRDPVVASIASQNPSARRLELILNTLHQRPSVLAAERLDVRAWACDATPLLAFRRHRGIFSGLLSTTTSSSTAVHMRHTFRAFGCPVCVVHAHLRASSSGPAPECARCVWGPRGCTSPRRRRFGYPTSRSCRSRRPRPPADSWSCAPIESGVGKGVSVA